MLSIRRAVWAAALFGAGAVSTACKSNLQIDNFAFFANGTNSLGSQTSDDGTMQYITSNVANGGFVTFIPKTQESYFYESFACQQAASQNYTAVSFMLQGPEGGSVAVELQTQDNCSATTHNSSYNVLSGLTGARQQFTLPLDSFVEDANTDAVVALAFSEFLFDGVEAWSIGNIQFVCGAGTGNATGTVAPVPTATSIPSTIKSTTRSVPTTITTATKPTATATATATPKPTSPTCANLLIDDWQSQSRLTFLNYNAMEQATSDDGSMTSIVVDSNHVTLTPKDTDSYFYSEFGCLNAQNTYGGISFRIRAAAATTFSITMASVSECGGENTQQVTKTSTELGWAFDGTDRLYSFPFSAFSKVDVTKLQMIYFGSLTEAVRLGPMSFYCGSTASEYVLPATRVSREVGSNPPAAEAAAPAAEKRGPLTSGIAFVLENFADAATNAIGQWHGADDDLTVTLGRNTMTIATNDSDLGWYTTLAENCVDFRPWAQSYLHIGYSGSNKFSIALQQHNAACNEDIAPFPETWDSLEAARYATKSDIYIPISHFNINTTRTIGFALKGFYSTTPTVFNKMELVDSLPAGWGPVPAKLPSGQLVFACKRPNSFAFAIDDGDPALAQQVMDIVKAEDVPVTFFAVGLPLLDPQTNLSSVYRDMHARGHQIAMHSYTHPKMEGLPDTASIDWEYTNDIGAVRQVFGDSASPAAGGNKVTTYFRPPFGTEGARMRQRLVQALAGGGDGAAASPEPYIVQWSVDVEDWLWAESATPEKQLEAFKRDLAKGGDLVVMHYLYPSTVGYLKEFVQLAKATGKRLMRVDQCMMDPNAPPLE